MTQFATHTKAHFHLRRWLTKLDQQRRQESEAQRSKPP
jgi:hypothetical protein